VNHLSGFLKVNDGGFHMTNRTRQRRPIGSQTNRFDRFLLKLGVAGPTLFVAAFLVQGFTRPGYDPLRSWVSELSLGSEGWINVVNLIVSGALILGFGLGLRRSLRSSPGALWGPVAVIGCGISMILAGVFVTDPTGNYPPGVPRPQTVSTSGLIHDIAGPMIILTMTVACFALAAHFSDEPDGRRWAHDSRITGWIIPISFIMCSALVGLDYGGVLPGAPSGLFQRVSLILGSVWMVRLALKRSRRDPSNPLRR
jgi:Protein of unknown function (DUF998)